METFRQSPIIQELQTEAFEQGMERGERQALLRTLGLLLSTRFDVSVERFKTQLSQLDLTDLQRLTELALTINDVIQFEAHLSQMMPA